MASLYHFWFLTFMAVSINGQIINRLFNGIACRQTSNNGYYGECVPRSCCSSTSSVRNLCLSSQSVCCYGRDICQDHRNRYPLVSSSEINPFPVRGSAGYCDRYIVTRYDWQAEPPVRRPFRMPVRVNQVIIHHTGDEDHQCWSMEQCRNRLRRMQSYYQRQKRFPDIPWNFLISNHGDIFEGVGWDSQGYHTERWNDRSIGVAFIGDYDREAPSERALQALVHLLDCGVEARILDRYYRLSGHRDMRPTSCPGDYLYSSLRQLPGWSGVSSGSGDIIAETIGSSDEFEFDEDDFRRRSETNPRFYNNSSDPMEFSDIRENSTIV